MKAALQKEKLPLGRDKCGAHAYFALYNSSFAVGIRHVQILPSLFGRLGGPQHLCGPDWNAAAGIVQAALAHGALRQVQPVRIISIRIKDSKGEFMEKTLGPSATERLVEEDLAVARGSLPVHVAAQLIPIEILTARLRGAI